MIRAALLATALLATPASAATITHDRLPGTAFALATGDFTALAPPTPRGSVTTAGGALADGSTPILKFPSDAVPDGRYNPDGGPWIDSADLAWIGGSFSFPEPVTAFGFGITDANDQRNSHFSVSFGDAVASLDPQTEVEYGNVHWFTVLFDEPVTAADLTFSTRAGDGFGITTATMAPVPLPAGLALMLAGVGALAWVKRRKLTSA
jgi:hypothetical protein